MSALIIHNDRLKVNVLYKQTVRNPAVAGACSWWKSVPF